MPPIPTEPPWRIVRKPVLDALADDLGTFDAILCDPPYGLGFMGKGWDHGVPSADVWRAARTHLRPGALMLAFGGSRTWHRLAVGIEDAGLELRDTIFAWMYGSGWSKPADVGKYIDKRLGAKRAVVGGNPNARANRVARDNCHSMGGESEGRDITAPGSPEAERFDGYHANLKPACEPVVVARVPLDGGLAGNALAHGVAGFNVAGCRIGVTKRVPGGRPSQKPNAVYGAASVRHDDESGRDPNPGRWPANVVLTCDEAICGPGDPREIEHKPGCHVYELDRQSGWSTARPSKANLAGPVTTSHLGSVASSVKGHGFHVRIVDDGTASRFFYTGKVRASERGASAHPCMKPLALCEYLARLILPPVRRDGAPRRLLVPFSGSGSEMIGALRAGWDEVVGIEYDAGCDNPGKRPDYWADTAERRIAEFASKFASEFDLASLLAERGALSARDFKERGLDSRAWIDAGYARRDPAKRTRILQGRRIFARDGHRPETRLWYQLYHANSRI